MFFFSCLILLRAHGFVLRARFRKCGRCRAGHRSLKDTGIAGYFDSVYLPLCKGENELLIAVAEVSGGWGFMVRDSRAVFALDGMEKKWETPNDLRVTESAAYDPVRNCLYVSNYDPYNPSTAEGRQFISKVSMDGRIESLQWVGGLKNPTGLCVVGDKLYAVERQSIAEIDIPQARVLAHYPLTGAMMPNDIAAAPDGTLYVSDSNRGAVFKAAAGKVGEWLRNPEISRPNGIVVDGGKLYIGTNADGKLKSVDLATKEIRTLASFGPGIIDGLCAIGGETFIVSHNSVEKPVELFNALVPCLRPGGKVVVVEGEKGQGGDLNGNPLDDSHFRSREEYIAMFGKTKLKLDRIDDQSAPHHTTFILSRR